VLLPTTPEIVMVGGTAACAAALVSTAASNPADAAIGFALEFLFTHMVFPSLMVLDDFIL
jgi:hypothetical protein